jgi:phage tail tube protein FII
MIADVSAWNAKILDINNAPINLKGLITDVSSPMFEREFDTSKRAGEPGVIPRPKNLKEIEVSFTVKKVSRELIKALMEGVFSYNKQLTFQASAVVDSLSGLREMYVWTAKGYVSKSPFGNLNADGIEAEFSIMATYLEATFGTDTFKYDPVNYDGSINGVNQWADLKTSIG